ncbi:hypothetical protein KIPB_004538, partial [Kipferlia bialata]
VILVDDKDRVGGKLVLQSHLFFGSVQDTMAGTRGYEIASKLSDRLDTALSASRGSAVWLQSTAVGVFSDGRVGVMRRLPRGEDASGHGDTHREGEAPPYRQQYVVVRPKMLLVATGAMENTLSFPGNSLPGVYGAGGLQTLVNRDLVKAAKRVLIVGGGNVGLVAGYHAIQAGIEVVGLIEGMPRVGGYKVHADKLRRLGVPILCSHTVVCAEPGRDGTVCAVQTAEVDRSWACVPGTTQRWEVDAVLVAVGLSPVDAFVRQAREYGMRVYTAGDARRISEASSAMYTGRITGRDMARELLGETMSASEVDAHMQAVFGVIDSAAESAKAAVLSAPAGATDTTLLPTVESVVDDTVQPVLHCVQEIACNSCEASCRRGAIRLRGKDLTGSPFHCTSDDGSEGCMGCMQCVARCPGLAVTVVDTRGEGGNENPLVTMPCELSPADAADTRLSYVRIKGEDCADLGVYRVVRERTPKPDGYRRVVTVRMPRALAHCAVGVIPVPAEQVSDAVSAATDIEDGVSSQAPDALICRCERVTAATVVQEVKRQVALIKASHAAANIPVPLGPRGRVLLDANALKASLRIGMGACGGSYCGRQLPRLAWSAGAEIVPYTIRPMAVEANIGVIAESHTYTASGTPPSESAGYLTDPSLYQQTVVGTAPAVYVESGAQDTTIDAYTLDTLDTDVLVMGAGSAGLGVAVACARRNVSMIEAGEVPPRVLVLDTRTAAGQGDQKHAIGGVRSAMTDPESVLLVSESKRDFASWAQNTLPHETQGEADIGWSQSGYLFVAYGQRQRAVLERVIETQRSNAALGLHPDTGIRWVDREGVLGMVPGIEADGLLGAAYSPTDGVASPVRWAVSASTRAFGDPTSTGVSHVSCAHVVRVLPKTEADGGRERVLVRLKDRPNASEASDEYKVIRARVVIEALGAGVNLVQARSGLDPLHVYPDSHEALVTSEGYAPVKTPLGASGLTAGPMVVDLRDSPSFSNVYWYVTPEGQIVFCGTPRPPYSGLSETSTSTFLPEGCARLTGLVPYAAGLKVRRTWRGTYPNSPDGKPLVGPDPSRPGLFHVNGLGGHGFMLSCGLGRLVCDTVYESIGMSTSGETYPRGQRETLLDAMRVGRDFTADELLK